MPTRLGDPARWRLWSGVVLFAFTLNHFVNHALGLVSLAAMEAGRGALMAFWHTTPAEILLGLALLVHMSLGIDQLWQRRSLRMPAYTWLQIATGLLIPFWLTQHVLGTIGLRHLAEMRVSYASQFAALWPAQMGFMAVLLVLVWLHGCVGVHAWLRLKRWYRPCRAPALALAVLLPTLAGLGTLTAGREFALARSADPARFTAIAREEGWPALATAERLVQAPAARIVSGLQWLVLLLLVARLVRWGIERHSRVRLTYPGGRVVSVPRGLSLLEASRARGIPHAAVCGGQGRCSTCRVRVAAGASALPPPSAEERRVLERIRAAPDVRLACQVRPNADLTLTPLLHAEVGPEAVMQGMDPSRGSEREIAVLFADLRGFTRLSEGRLPYDTVFVLNRYFGAMGEAVEAAGGRVDKFIGDGIMALFGVRGDSEAAARNALLAARGMAEALDVLNRELAPELDAPLRMGMGLHLGPAIVGEMGYGRATSLTAIGDTVNVASRLETLTKELDAQLVVSERLARRMKGALDGFPLHEVDLRGRSGRLRVRLVADARALPAPVVAKRPGGGGWRAALGAWSPGRRPLAAGSGAPGLGRDAP